MSLQALQASYRQMNEKKIWFKGNENNRVNNRNSDRHTNRGKQTEPPTEAETQKWKKKERGTDAVREMRERERKGEKKDYFAPVSMNYETISGKFRENLRYESLIRRMDNFKLGKTFFDQWLNI